MEDSVKLWPDNPALRELKDKAFHSISPADDGGLDRKSVLIAMEKYAEAYHLEKVIEAHRNQPSEFISIPSAVKKAKEIALQAAINNKPPYIHPSSTLGQNSQLGGYAPIYDITNEAEKIYNWLIKE